MRDLHGLFWTLVVLGAVAGCIAPEEPGAPTPTSSPSPSEPEPMPQPPPPVEEVVPLDPNPCGIQPHVVFTTTHPYPEISGSWVVYSFMKEGDRLFSEDLKLHNFVTREDRTLTYTPDHEVNQVIDGNLVAWRTRHGNYDYDTIDAYDIAANRTWTVTRELMIPRAMSGPLVVVERESNDDVGVLDVHTSAVRWLDGGDPDGMDIWGDRVVWATRDGNHSKLFVHNLTTNERTLLAEGAERIRDPAIHGDRVAFIRLSGPVSGHYDMYLMRLGDEPVKMNTDTVTNQDAMLDDKWFLWTAGNGPHRWVKGYRFADNQSFVLTYGMYIDPSLDGNVFVSEGFGHGETADEGPFYVDFNCLDRPDRYLHLRGTGPRATPTP